MCIGTLAERGLWQRFEKEAPNLLWQMDFKGCMPLADGCSRHPLTMVDDHSRFAVNLSACTDEQGTTIKMHLKSAFRRYGLPEAIFVDNGSPWGDPSGQPWTWLGVWLLKLGVVVIHSRLYHPQSRGKNERFHRTLKVEVFALRHYRDLGECQRALDHWRNVHNLERPHEALGQDCRRAAIVQVPACEVAPAQGPGSAMRQTARAVRRIATGHGGTDQPKLVSIAVPKVPKPPSATLPAHRARSRASGTCRRPGGPAPCRPRRRCGRGRWSSPASR